MRSEVESRLDTTIASSALAAAAERDPILEVAGLSAADILKRCEEIRRHGRPARGFTFARPAMTIDPVAPGGWRLLDFADLGDGDFVRQAHRVLLGRSPSPGETSRRLRDLRDRSRMELIIRLALSPEGRSRRKAEVRGIGLLALAELGRAVEAGNRRPALLRASARCERLARSALSGSSTGRRASARMATVAVVTLAAVAVDRRHRRPDRSRGRRSGFGDAT
jgi:hypothetical protein